MSLAWRFVTHARSVGFGLQGAWYAVMIIEIRDVACTDEGAAGVYLHGFDRAYGGTRVSGALRAVYLAGECLCDTQ